MVRTVERCAHNSGAWLQLKAFRQAHPDTPCLQATGPYWRPPPTRLLSLWIVQQPSLCAAKVEVIPLTPPWSWRRSFLTLACQVTCLATYSLKAHFFLNHFCSFLSKLFLPRVHSISPFSERSFWIRYTKLIPSGNFLLCKMTSS